jgi:hypothetical protein
MQARACPKRVVGPAHRAGRAQGVCKTGDREAILAASVTSLRMSCSRPAAERGPYLLFPALSHMLTLFGCPLNIVFHVQAVQEVFRVDPGGEIDVLGRGGGAVQLAGLDSEIRFLL